MLGHVRGGAAAALLKQSSFHNASILMARREATTKSEAPEAMKAEATKSGASKIESPKPETPKVETPKVEIPKMEAPKTKVDAPKSNTGAEIPPPPKKSGSSFLLWAAITAAAYAGFSYMYPETAASFNKQAEAKVREVLGMKDESTKTKTPAANASLSPRSPLSVTAATPVTTSANNNATLSIAPVTMAAAVDTPVVKTPEISTPSESSSHAEPIASIVNEVLAETPSKPSIVEHVELVETVNPVEPVEPVETISEITPVAETPSPASTETTSTAVKTPEVPPTVVEKTTLSAEAIAASSLLESNARLAEIRNSFTTQLSVYESGRASQLSRLSSTLRKAGPEAAERAIALMEAEDLQFFESCRSSLDGYISEIEANAAATISFARASQAAHFAEALHRETEQLRADLDRQYSEFANTLVADAVAQVTTGYEEQFLRISLEHSKSLEALSARYSSAIDNMMQRVESVSRAAAERKKYDALATNVARIDGVLRQVETLVSVGKPFTAAWADLAALAAEDPLLQAAMAVVPAQSVTLGVSPISFLQRQFSEIESPIRRAAYMTPKNDIVSKLVSGVFSFITFPQAELVGVPPEASIANAPKSASEPLNDEFYNLVAYDHARLSRAKFFVNRGEIALAVKELQNLKGVHTHDIANEFIDEARRRLITMQAIQVIRNHANSLHKEAYEHRQ